MEPVLVLLVIQLAASFAGIGFLWRKLDDLKGELGQVRQAVDALEIVRAAPARRTRELRSVDLFAAAAAVASPAADAPPPQADTNVGLLSDDPFSDSWVRPNARAPTSAQHDTSLPPLLAMDGEEGPTIWREPVSTRISPDSVRALVAVAALAAPAIGFMFALPTILLALAGLGFATLILLLSLRLNWQAPAWAATIGAGAWALTGIETQAAANDTILFSGALAIAAAAGLVQARLLRRAWSGALMSLLMAAAALALCAQTTFIGPQGAAFGAIVAAAAAIGASKLRRDALHLTAFAAAGAGLLVHSGQADAAIWFTPLAAWMGALFFGIAAVRTPAFGSRGALIAATGVIAPMFAAGSLRLSRQGLAEPYATAGALVLLAALFAGLLALTARRAGGVDALKLTTWVLVTAIAVSIGAATLIALPTTVAAGVLGTVVLAFIGAARLWPDNVWRFFAALFAGAALGAALVAARGIGATTETFGPYGAIGLALVLPAGMLGLAARTAKGAPLTAGWLEMGSIALALAAVTAIIRVAFSNGAPALQPISFVEAGMHATAWMSAALLLSARAEEGAGDVRRAYALLLCLIALGAIVIATPLWLTPFWTLRAGADLGWGFWQHAPLGFALPAIAAWAHWVYWRHAHAHRRTHLALGVAGFLTAAFVTFEVALQRPVAHETDWTLIGAGMLAFALAGALHFAPGATSRAPDPRQLDLEEYLKRHRRSEQRG